jgi:hypothetical protein
MPPPCCVLAPAHAALSCSSPAACRWAFITTCAVSLCPSWLRALHHHAPQDNRHALLCRQHAHLQHLSWCLVRPAFALGRALSSGWSCCAMPPVRATSGGDLGSPEPFCSDSDGSVSTSACPPVQPTCPLAAPVLGRVCPQMGPLERLVMLCMTLSGPLTVVTQAHPSLFMAMAMVAWQLQHPCGTVTAPMSPPQHAAKLPSWSHRWYREFRRDLARHVLVSCIDRLIASLPYSKSPCIVSEVDPCVLMFGIKCH